LEPILGAQRNLISQQGIPDGRFARTANIMET